MLVTNDEILHHLKQEVAFSKAYKRRIFVRTGVMFPLLPSVCRMSVLGEILQASSVCDMWQWMLDATGTLHLICTSL